MKNYTIIAEKIKREIIPKVSENSEIVDIAVFIHLSEIILENAFLREIKIYSRNNIKEKDIIKNFYPYFYENEAIKKFPISEELRLEVKDSINGDQIVDIIGKLYEDYVPVSRKKDIGQFYTRSNDLIDSILDNVGFMGDEIPRKKVIDPAAGSGMLLIRSISRLKEHMKGKGYTAIEILQKINNNFYAVDVDPFAAYLIEMNILIEIMDLAVETIANNEQFTLKKFNIFIGDFTLAPQKEINLFSSLYNSQISNDVLERLKLKEEEFSDGFDIVLSNPPYITMYGRRSRNMSEEKRDYYNAYYDFVQNKKGNNKFNSIMFFIERSIKMIHEKQKIAFIIDMSFFETAFKDMRKYILENCTVEKIIVGLKEFDNVASGQILLFLTKEKDEAVRFNNTVEWVEHLEDNILEIKQHEWYRPDNEYKFFKPLSGEENDIFKKIESFPTLKKYFPKKQLRTCCALTGRSEDFMVDESKYKTDKNNLIFPYLEGAKGVKYKFGNPNHTNFLNYDYDLQLKISDEFKEELTKLGVKNKKRVTLGDRECYLAPKIFIRQSAKILIATYTEDKYAANNSIYVLTNKDTSEENKRFLKYVCALINSDLLTFYAQKKRIIRMGNGKTPQIKISDLHNLRLNIDTKIYDDVINITEKLSSLNENSEKYDENIKKMNDLIYSSYGITDREVKYIQKEIIKAVE